MNIFKTLISIISVFAISFLLVVTAAHAGTDVTLAWDPNTESELAGYKLYQAEKIGNTTTAWSLVAEIPAGTETHTIIIDDYKNYAWLVTAYDAAGNESFVSNMVERYDRVPPGYVKNFRKQE